MDEHLARKIGAQVRAQRAAKRQTQAVVAGLSGITTDYLYQIERGKKLPTIPVLTQLAVALGVEIGSLLGEAGSPPVGTNQFRVSSAPVGRRRRPEHANEPRHRTTVDPGEALYRALTQPFAAPMLHEAEKSHQPPSFDELRLRVRDAWYTWQTSPERYSALVEHLPTIIADTEQAERRQGEKESGEYRKIQRCAADLYGLLRTVCKRVGRVDLSLLVADRAIRAADSADDPHRQAAACWNLAHVLLAEGRAEGAESVAMQAAHRLQPHMKADDLDAVALSGALTLLGAVASVRQGQIWTARQRICSASQLAKLTGERNVLWTVFGPTNVAMYAVSVEIEAGEAAESLRLAEQIDYERSPSIERRVAFLLDQAKAHVQRREYASSLLLLQAAARMAREDIVYRPAAHQLFHTVIRQGRRTVASEAAQLAKHAGLPIS